MAFGAATHNTGHSAGKGSNTPTRADFLTFAGDGAYAAGGTAAFEAYVQDAVGAKVTVVGVVGQDCGGYIPVYDPANDKLKVYEQTDTATTPLIETATANLSGTNFNVLVLSK